MIRCPSSEHRDGRIFQENEGQTLLVEACSDSVPIIIKYTVDGASLHTFYWSCLNFTNPQWRPLLSFLPPSLLDSITNNGLDEFQSTAFFAARVSDEFHWVPWNFGDQVQKHGGLWVENEANRIWLRPSINSTEAQRKYPLARHLIIFITHRWKLQSVSLNSCNTCDGSCGKTPKWTFDRINPYGVGPCLTPPNTPLEKNQENTYECFHFIIERPWRHSRNRALCRQNRLTCNFRHTGKRIQELTWFRAPRQQHLIKTRSTNHVLSAWLHLLYRACGPHKVGRPDIKSKTPWFARRCSDTRRGRIDIYIYITIVA